MNSYYEKSLLTQQVTCIDDEIPFDLPQGWEWARLQAVGVTETGTTPSKTHPEYFGDEIPFIGPGNISDNKIQSITQGISALGKAYCRIIPEDSILQVCIGGSIGKAAINDRSLAFNQQINSITPLGGCISHYIYCILITEWFRQSMLEKSTGTATPIINRTNWESLLIPVAPVKEQAKICSKIRALNPYLDKYAAENTELLNLNKRIFESLKKSVLQEAIHGKLVPQIESEGTADMLLEEIAAEKKRLVSKGKLKRSALTSSTIIRGDDNKYYEKSGNEVVCIDDEIPFEIPHTWSWVRLGDVFNFINGDRGKNYPSKDKLSSHGDIPFISAINIVNGCLSEENLLYLSQSQFDKLGSGKLLMNDVVICIRGSLAKACVFPLSQGAIASSLVILRKYCEVSIPYVISYIKSPLFQDEIMKYNNGTAQPNLSAKDLGRFLFPLPPIAEQTRIIKAINSIASIMRR